MYSYWEQSSFFAKQDIIIVGAGFVGLWTAIELQKEHPNYNITIIEKGIIPTGASTKNAGFGCFGSPTELINDAKLYGENVMWNLVDKRYNGLRKIHNTFSYQSIDYENCGGYECLLEKDYLNVQEKLEWLNKGLKSITGVDNVFCINNKKIKENGLSNFDYLIENKLEGQLHPAKLIIQLQQKAGELGIQILSGLNIIHYEIKENTVYIITENNINFSSKKIIICNNAFAKKLLPTIDVEPKRGQIFITNEIQNFPLKGCFHFDEGYYYFRNVGNRLLIGGARNIDFDNENTDVFETTTTIQESLQSFTEKHILKNKPFIIEQQWSGIMGFGKEKQPIIEKINNQVFVAVRMSGMGVALAPLVAEDIVKLITA